MVLTDGFYRDMKKRLKGRVSPERYEHAKSVAATAVRIAQAYGVDERKARLAGLVHDWDKDYSDAEIRLRVAELGVAVDAEMLESMPRMLHGPTGAVALGREFPDIGEDILQAVSRHTFGALDMSDLDMVVYVADLVEPKRTRRAMGAMYDAVGTVSLEELFFATYRQVLASLIERTMPIHPDTVRIWNHAITKRKGTS
jgi:predicted HD superfamily hydrolase involved in NAD metabolism